MPEKANEGASLISDLDHNGWLSSARNALRDSSVPASLRALLCNLEEALFQLSAAGVSDAAQETLIVLGALMLEVARRPQLRENLKPLPRLSRRWVAEAYDGSPEFGLAAALASLGAPPAQRAQLPAKEESADATLQIEDETERAELPFRSHLAPLEMHGWYDAWADTTEARSLVVWTGRDLVRDLAAVLERRLIENERHRFVDENGRHMLPLGGPQSASLSAICAFLTGRTDDSRIAALATGLAWVRPMSGTSGAEHEPLPFAYAALKPLFAPDGVGAKREEKHRVDPLPLLRLIRAGRVTDAIASAQRFARGAGLPTPFATLVAPSVNAARLAAALLFPIRDYDTLTKRVYPDQKQREDDSDAA